MNRRISIPKDVIQMLIATGKALVVEGPQTQEEKYPLNRRGRREQARRLRQMKRKNGGDPGGLQSDR